MCHDGILEYPAAHGEFFARIDAAGVTDPALKLALDQWMARRNGHILGAAAAEILKPDLQRTFVSRLKNRLVAVRLRRLLQLVSETEEPVAVLFDIAETEGQFEVEILAAPTTGGHRTEAIFCGIVRRKRQQIAWHLPAK